MYKKQKRLKRNRVFSIATSLAMLISFIVILPLMFSLLSLSERKLKEEDEYVVKVYNEFECAISLVSYKTNSDELSMTGGILLMNSEVEKFYISIDGYDNYDFTADYKLVKYADGSIMYSYILPYIYDINNIRLQEKADIDVKIYAVYAGKDYMVDWNIMTINGSLESYDLNNLDLSKYEKVYPEMSTSHYSDSGWTIVDSRMDQVRVVANGVYKVPVKNIDYYEIQISGTKYYLVKGYHLFFRNAFNISKGSFYVLTNEDVLDIKAGLN